MVQIRLAKKEDLNRIFEIEQEAFSPHWTKDDLLVEIKRDDSFFFVVSRQGDGSFAQGDGSLVRFSRWNRTREPSPCAKEPSPCLEGFFILRRTGDDGELLQIAVDKKAQRSGLGDLLMEAVLKYAKENEFNSIFLEVRSSNTAALCLYKKHKFKEIRVRKDYYENPVEDALVLRRINF